MNFVVFWFVVPCRVVVGHQHFGGPVVPSSSGPSTLKIETVCFSETLVSNHHITRNNNAESHEL